MLTDWLKNMNRVNLFIDADDTLIDSNLAVRQLYAETFNLPLPPEINVWNGKDVLLEAPDNWIEDAFTSDRFWELVTVKENAKGILSQLKESGKYNMFICSIGRKQNIIQKIHFIEQSGLSEYFQDCIFLTKYSQSVNMGKGFLHANSILIDDNHKNFSSVKYPILFWDGKFKSYNEGYEGLAVNGWNDDLIKTVEMCFNQEQYNRKWRK